MLSPGGMWNGWPVSIANLGPLYAISAKKLVIMRTGMMDKRPG